MRWTWCKCRMYMIQCDLSILDADMYFITTWKIESVGGQGHGRDVDRIARWNVRWEWVRWSTMGTTYIWKTGTLNASEIRWPCWWGGGHLTCKCWNDFEDIITPVVYWINGINVHMRWSIRSMYTDLSMNSYRRRSIRGSHADLSTNAHRWWSIGGGRTDLSTSAHRRRSIRGGYTDLSTNAHRRQFIRGGHTDPSMSAHRWRSIHGIHTDLSTNAHRWQSIRGGHTDLSTNAHRRQSIRGICIDESLRYIH